MSTAYLFDEWCLWHEPGQFALVAPVGGYIQGGTDHPDSPETKRRLHNLLQTSGLHKQLVKPDALSVTDDDLLRIHSKNYIEKLQKLSDGEGGDAGECAPFSKGAIDIARISASLVKTSVFSVLCGDVRTAYALSRPAGHHAEVDQGRGFCMLANIPIAIEAARDQFGLKKVAIIDWDVHHGNGQESIYYSDPNTLTISLHQEEIYPAQRGHASHRGIGKGSGACINIPVLPGSGGGAYMDAFDRCVIPQLEAFQPELIVVACGFDASIYDPLGRCMLSSEDYRTLTLRLMDVAQHCCDGRLVCAHEGGYSAAYVPFCGLAVIESLSGIRTDVVDPMLELDIYQQPAFALRDWQRAYLDNHLITHANESLWSKSHV